MINTIIFHDFQCIFSRLRRHGRSIAGGFGTMSSVWLENFIGVGCLLPIPNQQQKSSVDKNRLFLVDSTGAQCSLRMKYSKNLQLVSLIIFHANGWLVRRLQTRPVDAYVFALKGLESWHAMSGEASNSGQSKDDTLGGPSAVHTSHFHC